MCYCGCQYENREGECMHKSPQPCGIFEICPECGYEMSHLDLEYSKGLCINCRYDFKKEE